ncbi:Nuclear distribution protein nudE 1 [Vanrija pseudolonga]|uniref:Nuclear distribution protein nudE 1 n=1 Tax=Vanrija pseudolonga TaxID=143232 RepID=A0AAF0Y7Y7_9TREE|nr:Nuclear distribution protein nudE 1 [Vanrija pseudolonga]
MFGTPTPANGFPASPMDKAMSNLTLEEDDDDLTEEANYYRDKYRVAIDLLNETRNELDEFQLSSRELEQELEKELEATEAKQAELQQRIKRLDTERDEWKTKFINLQMMHSSTVSAMQREMDNLRSERDKTLIALRDLEMGNDELERNERVAVSSLLDMEIKYNRAIEEKTLLEQEAIQRQELEEECQRLKDDVRDANNEIAILRDQLARAVVPTPPSSNAPMSPYPSSNAPMSPYPDKRSHSRSASRASAASPTPSHRSTTSTRSNATERSAVTERSGDRSATATPRTVRGLTRSTTAQVLASPAVRRPTITASPSGIPALSRSTTTRNLAAAAAPSPAPRTRPSYAPSPARAASHQAAKTKGFKLLQDLQARLKATDDRIGTKMSRRNLATTATQPVVPRRQPTVSTASSTISAASVATKGSSRTVTSTVSAASHNRVSALNRTPAALSTPGAASDGVFSPSGWVMLSDLEDTPDPTLRASTNPVVPRDDSPSPLERNPSRSSATSRTRPLPSRPAIPSPLTNTLAKSTSRLPSTSLSKSTTTRHRSSLSASTSGMSTVKSSGSPRAPAPSRRTVADRLTSSTRGPPPVSRLHARTPSRSGAMSPSLFAGRPGALSPTLIPGPRRVSISTAADAFPSPPPSASTSTSNSSRASTALRPMPAEDNEPARSHQRAQHGSLGRGLPPAVVNGAAAASSPEKSGAATLPYKRAGRRSSLSAAEAALSGPSGIPGPKPANGRPTSYPGFSDTPPPVPRIPSAVLKENAILKESTRNPSAKWVGRG